MTKVIYYYRYNKDVRLVYFAERWNERNLKAKGMHIKNIIAKRKMTDLEIEEYKDYKREFFLKYTNWEFLFEDDKNVNVPDEFINKIKKFAKKNPLPGSELPIKISDNQAKR